MILPLHSQTGMRITIKVTDDPSKKKNDVAKSRRNPYIVLMNLTTFHFIQDQQLVLGMTTVHFLKSDDTFYKKHFKFTKEGTLPLFFDTKLCVIYEQKETIWLRSIVRF